MVPANTKHGDVVVVSTKTITIFEIFHGTVQVKHVPPAKPAEKSAPPAKPTKKSAQPTPTDHARNPEPTAERRKLQSSGSCSNHDGNCRSCLASTEPGSFYGTYDCSYCTGDGRCGYQFLIRIYQPISHRLLISAQR